MTSWLMVLAQAGGTTVAGDNDAALIWAVVLLCVSIVLLVVELFVPSGGLIAALATVAAIGSVIAFFRYDETWGFVAVASYLVLGPIATVYALKWWVNSPLGRRMILMNPGEGDVLDPDSPSPQSSEHARLERLAQLRQLIGARGVATTVLRPVGVVKIEGQRLDALAEAGVIESGSAVVVTEVLDNQVKVRKAD